MPLVVLALATAGCRSTSGTSTPAPASPFGTPGAPASAAPGTPSQVPPTPTSVPPTPVATATQANGTIRSHDLVDVLRVRCGETGLELGSDRVRAARDGVHLVIAGTAGYHVGLEHETGGDGVSVQGEAQEVVQLIPPGTLAIGCGLPADPWPLPGFDVRVEDPSGVYRPYALGMGAGGCVSGSASYAAGARGDKAQPVKQARAHLAGLRAGDVVQRAGYPVETGRVRVVRGGEVIGSLEYEPDGHGGWLLMNSTLCEGVHARG